MEGLCVFVWLSALYPLTLTLEAYEHELSSHLSSSLHHYESLHPHTVTHTLHGSPSLPSHSRLVQFHVLDQHFQLYLKPHSRLFSPGLKVQSVDGNGKKQIHHINQNEYYLGFVGGEENSVVSAHVSPDGIITGSVRTSLDTYHFEPSEHFLNKPHPLHTIVYRASDVKDRLKSSKFDYVVAPPLTPEEQLETTEDQISRQPPLPGEPIGTVGTHWKDQESDDYGANNRDNPHQRLKRQSRGSVGGNSCPMALISDYRFFNQFGRGGSLSDSVAGISRRLISLVSEVDIMIYRDTVWVLDLVDEVNITGLGLEIAELIIRTNASTGNFQSDPLHYYNSEQCCRDVDEDGRTQVDAGNLLSALNYGGWDNYCLAHLFTNEDFPSGLLGLANIASSFQSQTGGICSRSFRQSSKGQRIVYNTGLSSFISGENPLVRAEQVLVVGHEVGHNWGSQHDSECGDNYLMNEFAQDGSRASHRRFSRCSRVSIGAVLQNKAQCFRDRNNCGDYVKNSNESCDEGPMGGVCCTPDCQLRPGAMCSDTNYPCCQDCRTAPSGVVCNTAGNFTENCTTDIHCNGTSFECPNINTTGTALPGSECLRGLCQAQDANSNFTVCVGICAFNNLTECSCPSGGDQECLVCCRDGDTCSPAIRLGNTVPRPTGSQCEGGSCVGGRCLENQDTISRIFQIIANLDINDLVLFMEENIVGFTIIFTLILWVPSSILLYCCYDRKIFNKFKKDLTDYGHDYGIASFAENLPLIKEFGDFDRCQSSPVDDGPPPSYASVVGRGLRSIPEEEEEEELESRNGNSEPVEKTIID